MRETLRPSGEKLNIGESSSIAGYCLRHSGYISFWQQLCTLNPAFSSAFSRKIKRVLAVVMAAGGLDVGISYLKAEQIKPEHIVV